MTEPDIYTVSTETVCSSPVSTLIEELLLEMMQESILPRI